MTPIRCWRSDMKFRIPLSVLSEQFAADLDLSNCLGCASLVSIGLPVSPKRVLACAFDGRRTIEDGLCRDYQVATDSLINVD